MLLQAPAVGAQSAERWRLETVFAGWTQPVRLILVQNATAQLVDLDSTCHARQHLVDFRLLAAHTNTAIAHQAPLVHLAGAPARAAPLQLAVSHPRLELFI